MSIVSRTPAVDVDIDSTDGVGGNSQVAVASPGAIGGACR